MGTMVVVVVPEIEEFMPQICTRSEQHVIQIFAPQSPLDEIESARLLEAREEGPVHLGHASFADPVSDPVFLADDRPLGPSAISGRLPSSGQRITFVGKPNWQDGYRFMNNQPLGS